MKGLIQWLLPLCLAGGCSSGEPEQQAANPWKEQIEVMEQTQQVEQFVLDSADDRRRKIEDETR